MSSPVVADPAARPDVLPTDRLLVNGMLRPEMRSNLRKIANGRNALSVFSLWACFAALVTATVVVDTWWVVFIAFVLMGPLYSRFLILMHEAAHKLLFSNKRWNDWVGTWLLAYPTFTPISLYRRGHFAHHKEEFGPNEPDFAFYGGYPCDRAALRRRLVRDAVGISGWKNFVPLFRGLKSSAFRRISLSIIAVQLGLWAALWLATGRWWIYPVLWWLPWMTEWRVLNRLRAIAEHGGLIAGGDRRVTTHHVRQNWLARFWIVPFHTGWHLAHHVDMGIPWRNLPRFHEELVRAGYVTPSLTYPNYRALWRNLTSGPAPHGPVATDQRGG